MAKLLLLVALIALVSASKMFYTSPTGECAFLAGDVYIPFNHDKGRKFVSSAYGTEVIQSMNDITAGFEVISTFMPCGTFSCYNTIKKEEELTHLCLQLSITFDGSSDKLDISYPVPEGILETNMTATSFNTASETAELEFKIDLLGGDANLKKLYDEFMGLLSGSNEDLLNTFNRVINCVGGEKKDPLTLRMLFSCGNPQGYSSNNRLVFKYDKNRMIPENYDSYKEDGITIDKDKVCFGYTKYYTLATCSNPNSPEVKGNQVNVKENGLAAGGVVGIVIACVIVVAVIVAVALFFVIKKAAQ